MLSALEMDCLHFLITSVGEGWRGRREEGIMLGEFRKQRASCEMTFFKYWCHCPKPLSADYAKITSV